uniref:Aggrecan core protein n=1 Tax=Syphacia muris TaxID=451379 RepID=A0A0N5AVT3_9BILA
MMILLYASDYFLSLFLFLASFLYKTVPLLTGQKSANVLEAEISPPSSSLPSFHNLLPGDISSEIYNDFLRRQELLREVLFPTFPQPVLPINLLQTPSNTLNGLTDKPMVPEQPVDWSGQFYNGYYALVPKDPPAVREIVQNIENLEPNAESSRSLPAEDNTELNQVHLVKDGGLESKDTEKSLVSKENTTDVSVVISESSDEQQESVSATSTETLLTSTTHASDVVSTTSTKTQLNPTPDSQSSLNLTITELSKNFTVQKPEKTIPEKGSSVAMRVFDGVIDWHSKDTTKSVQNSVSTDAQYHNTGNFYSVQEAPVHPEAASQAELDELVTKLNLTNEQTQTFISLVEKFHYSIDESGYNVNGDKLIPSRISSRVREHLTSNTHLNVDEEQFAGSPIYNDRHHPLSYQAIEQAEYDKLISNLKNADEDLESLIDPIDTSPVPIDAVRLDEIRHPQTPALKKNRNP